jgi:Swt1-like HEPN
MVKDRSEPNQIEELIKQLPEMPADAPMTYIYLWQLETWLRQMIYVEFKSELGADWSNIFQQEKAEKSQQGDTVMTHMPGPERQLLSFSSLSDLRKIIEARWDPLFKNYFPPQQIWSAKLSEVEQVRHRIAHFRYGNAADAARVANFLRDIDSGLWRFCTSYNATSPILPSECDPISLAVADRVGGTPYTSLPDGRWVMVTPPRIRDVMTADIEINIRPWAARTGSPFCGKEGYVYSLTFIAFRGSFDYMPILARAARYEDEILHILLDSAEASIRFTLPAVAGQERLKRVIDDLFEVALRNARRRDRDDRDRTLQVQKLANAQPEYVLGPHNPLTFLGSDMPGTFFVL